MSASPPYLHEDYLLVNPVGRRLYHEVAAALPVIDYHNHLDARALAENQPFENLTRLWITADPYKHRAMRIAGVPETEISGPADDRRKFDRWAATVPLTLGNPLYAWTALELKRYFGIDEPLTPASAERVWRTANDRLAGDDFRPRRLLARCGVECAVTSDFLLDDLSGHQKLAAESRGAPRVLPSLRGDDVVAIESADCAAWVRRLSDMTGTAVKDFESFREAVVRRIDDFAAAGCRLADHALNDFAHAATDDATAANLFERRLRDGPLSAADDVQLRSAILRFLGREYRRRGWTLQLHLGAHRRTSTRLRTLAGPFGGHATVGNPTDVPSLCALLDDLEAHDGLPRVIVYSLNPALFAPLAVLTGSFAEDGVAGKIQLGPAWWYNDHVRGMRHHLEELSSHGLLATFVGMTTDSRSLLSMVRHEYFRRTFCQWVGEQVAAGHFPGDFATLAAQLTRRVCYQNAADTFVNAPTSRSHSVRSI